MFFLENTKVDGNVILTIAVTDGPRDRIHLPLHLLFGFRGDDVHLCDHDD